MDDRSFSSTRLATLCAGVAFSFATALCVASGDAEAADAQPRSADAPTAPTVRLAPIGAFADDAAFLADRAERAADLQRRADQQKDASRRIRLRQAAINIILAEQLEPACSWFLLTGVPTPRDIAGVVEALDQADAMLAQCAREIDALPPEPGADHAADDGARDGPANGGDDRGDGATDAGPQQTQRILVAFARGLRALMVPDGESDGHLTPRRAASQLSFMLEHENPRVVASATLWQACLRAVEDDSGPAKSILGDALANPTDGSMPYAFFGRLVRCRLMARDGGYAASLALLAQLEDVSADWFDEPAKQAEALRAVSLFEIETLIAWHEHLSPDTQTAERKWCADRVEHLRKDRFASDGVLRLRHAIPIVSPEPRPATTVP